jgi:hypothetical protein
VANNMQTYAQSPAWAVSAPMVIGQAYNLRFIDSQLASLNTATTTYGSTFNATSIFNSKATPSGIRFEQTVQGLATTASPLFTMLGGNIPFVAGGTSKTGANVDFVGPGWAAEMWNLPNISAATLPANTLRLWVRGQQDLLSWASCFKLPPTRGPSLPFRFRPKAKWQ